MAKREDDSPEAEDDDDDDLDTILATNYNTISSLAALKELLHGSTSGDDSDDDTAWFQHYFLHHVNRLPKQELRSPYLRPIIEGRRLSECREVPEEDDPNAVPKHHESSSEDLAESEPSEIAPAPSAEPEAAKPESPVKTRLGRFTVRAASPGASVRRRLVKTGSASSSSSSPSSSFTAIDPAFPRHTSPLPSPHLDKRFFDGSMIEMKSQASSSSTLDSTEDIWVRRDDVTDTARRKKELQGSQPLPVINVTDDVDGSMASHEGGGRPRAGTWSISQSRQSQPQSHLHVGHGGSAGNNSASSQHESSSSKQPRRRSGDDINLVQGSAPTSANASQAASPSRKPALFDSFRPRSKSDATRTKKSGTIISHMKSAMQHSLMSSPASSRNQSPNELSSSHSPSSELAANQSSAPGRPRAGSESSGKGPVSKVMDMFRYRSHSAVSAEDKRKAPE